MWGFIEYSSDVLHSMRVGGCPKIIFKFDFQSLKKSTTIYYLDNKCKEQIYRQLPG